MTTRRETLPEVPEPFHFRPRRVLELEWEFPEDDDSELGWLEANAQWRHTEGSEFMVYVKTIEASPGSLDAKLSELRLLGLGRLARAIEEARKREAEFLLFFVE